MNLTKPMVKLYAMQNLFPHYVHEVLYNIIALKNTKNANRRGKRGSKFIIVMEVNIFYL